MVADDPCAQLKRLAPPAPRRPATAAGPSDELTEFLSKAFPRLIRRCASGGKHAACRAPAEIRQCILHSSGPAPLLLLAVALLACRRVQECSHTPQVKQEAGRGGAANPRSRSLLVLVFVPPAARLLVAS